MRDTQPSAEKDGPSRTKEDPKGSSTTQSVSSQLPPRKAKRQVKKQKEEELLRLSRLSRTKQYMFGSKGNESKPQDEEHKTSEESAAPTQPVTKDASRTTDEGSKSELNDQVPEQPTASLCQPRSTPIAPGLHHQSIESKLPSGKSQQSQESTDRASEMPRRGKKKTNTQASRLPQGQRGASKAAALPQPFAEFVPSASAHTNHPQPDGHQSLTARMPVQTPQSSQPVPDPRFVQPTNNIYMFSHMSGSGQQFPQCQVASSLVALPYPAHGHSPASSALAYDINFPQVRQTIGNKETLPETAREKIGEHPKGHPTQASHGAPDTSTSIDSAQSTQLPTGPRAKPSGKPTQTPKEQAAGHPDDAIKNKLDLLNIAESANSTDPMWSQSKSWVSDEEKERAAFQKMMLQMRHINADKSPFIPQTPAELTAFKVDQAERAKKKLEQELQARLLANAQAKQAQSKKNEENPELKRMYSLFFGMNMGNLSPVLFFDNCFNQHYETEASKSQRAEWPCLAELKEDGDRRAAGYGRLLPLPKLNKLDAHVQAKEGTDATNKDGSVP
ncbi:hypothetical protein N3K66_003534 [Trichothecium roseum]|uniref:Uncharacterized protein n=1 Tax=Trichothecium roseum TaxID=47278 RepID=A0ACC0V8B4_9HYPO|nr:hypothetical protein N3K66_003534 [Trichothecium roseum]